MTTDAYLEAQTGSCPSICEGFSSHHVFPDYSSGGLMKRQFKKGTKKSSKEKI
jgi:hypothetical protein